MAEEVFNDLGLNMYMPDNTPAIRSDNDVIGLVKSTKKSHETTIPYGFEFGTEMQCMQEIEEFCHRGIGFVRMLYCFRGCARSLPMVEAKNIHRKDDIYNNSFQVLRPQMLKLKNLMDFCNQAVNLLSSNIQKLTTQENYRKIIPDMLLEAFIHLLDLIIKLDQLKDTRAGLQNDFSFYKRAFQHVKDAPYFTKGQEEISKEIIDLQMFLGNPQYPKCLVFNLLKNEIHNVKNYGDILCLILKSCVDRLEHKLYILGDEKFQLIRVIPFLLLLLDNEINDKVNIFKSTKIKVDVISKILRRNPVIPVYGDMSLQPLKILEKLSFVSIFNFSSDAKIRGSDYLRSHWKEMRVNYNNYLPRLVKSCNNAGLTQDISQNQAITFSKVVFSITLEGFCLLNTWKATILQQLAWKYQNPVSIQRMKQLGANLDYQGVEYERVVRYNYSSEELSVLVDSICLIKSLVNTLKRFEPQILPLINMNIYHEMQMFSQHTLLPFLHRADKNKRKSLKTLIALRSMVADWASGEVPLSDFKSKRCDRKFSELRNRCVGTDLNRLQQFRTTLQSLYDRRSEGMKSTNVFGKKDFDNSEVSEMENFYDSSFFFPYLLDFENSLDDLADLSDLWFREFYLEMTKCPQFPIEMSLPWMLTEHVLLNPSCLSSHLIEGIIHVLEIYNDAADRSLRKLRQKFLFDEIQAEANLCFDQLVFLISDQIYTYYKNCSADFLLEKCYKEKLKELRNEKSFTVSKRFYDSLMQQRHVKMLDKYVDINFLIGQHINAKISKDIEAACQKFEANELSHIIEFEFVLQILKDSHSRLAIHLKLDSFENLFEEVNESINPDFLDGRLATHILSRILSELVPNYSYNAYTHRFVRPSIVPKHPDTKEAAPKKNYVENVNFSSTIDLLNKLYRGFIGLPHFEAITRLLSDAEILSLVDEVLKFIETKLLNALVLCNNALGSAIPPCKLPKFMYKAEGCFGYFEGKFKHILKYDDLKPQVFQTFREFGNIIAFISAISDTMDVKFNIKSNLSTHFLTGDDSNSGTIDYQQSNIFRVLQKLPCDTGPSIEEIFAENSRINKKNILFSSLYRIEEILASSGFLTEQKKCLRDHNSDNTFFRVWSALKFLYCLPLDIDKEMKIKNKVPHRFGNRENFGDGFILAGCTLLHLLGQIEHFNTFDFTRHVINVSNSDLYLTDTQSAQNKKLVGSLDEDMSRQAQLFIENASKLQQVDFLFFSTFKAVFPDPRAIMEKVLSVIQPPKAKNTYNSKTIKITSETDKDNCIATEARRVSCLSSNPIG